MKVNPSLLNSYQKVGSLTQKEKVEVPSFKDFLVEKIKEVDQAQKQALASIEALAKGEEVDLSDVALTISKADTNFKLLLRIRNKVLEAYQEIMRMQI
ncbi:flagellar hook-basal body complex protein FliE [Thermodesulfobacterium sp. TA1]|uniref:flagellar hook-basal body complex protein FliE n=1 Tax=Thermodesulfobacterium sp. TA1 TaxID=2234087 RepID=UPI00123220FC|nr:flagellar hook-basal body complex protein FliE [Thermodesulfobacterium sp. TA1]QER41625.1 flagellar hook-basal body complex protein FliE [Thermodesulfobacterium sp. TA1]